MALLKIIILIISLIIGYFYFFSGDKNYDDPKSVTESVQQLSPEELARQQALERERKAEALKAKFEQRLDELAPDWRIQEKDPEFQEWLLNKDPETNIVRIETLKAAMRYWDHETVVKIFNKFIDETAEAREAERAKVKEEYKDVEEFDMFIIDEYAKDKTQ